MPAGLRRTGPEQRKQLNGESTHCDLRVVFGAPKFHFLEHTKEESNESTVL
jgi:hypothetical protein